MMKAPKSLAIPYAVWVLIFTVVPLGLVVGFAMTDQDGSLTLENIFAMSEYMSVLFDHRDGHLPSDRVSGVIHNLPRERDQPVDTCCFADGADVDQLSFKNLRLDDPSRAKRPYQPAARADRPRAL